jgi:hypothetical protein
MLPLFLVREVLPSLSHLYSDTRRPVSGASAARSAAIVAYIL